MEEVEIIAAVVTLLVIVSIVGVMAYKHDREIRKSQDEINKK
jgi:hypothetical protein